MKILIILLFSLMIPWPVLTQSQFDFDWTVQSGSPDYDYVLNMDKDSSGNAYFFLESRWSECHIADSLVNGNGLYIAKFNDQGDLVRTSYISCTSIIGARTLRATPEGDIYLMGLFNDTANFGSITLVDTSELNVTFLARLNPEGNFNWAEIVYPSPDFIPYDMEIDSEENIFITGVNPGYYMIIGNDTIFGELGGWKLPLIQYDSSGTPVWGIMTDNSLMARGYDLSVDPAGNIVIAGSFMGLKLFFGEDSVITQSSKNLLLTSITPGIGFNWLKIYPYDGEMYVNKMLVNPDGEIFTSGFFHGEILFSTDTVNIPAFHEQLTLFGFSPEGDYNWHLESVPVQDYGTRASGDDMCFDDEGNIFVAGKFSTIIDVGDFRLVADPPNLYAYNLLLQVNNKGRVLLAESIYGRTYAEDYAARKVCYHDGFLYYSGSFEYSGYIGNEYFSSYGLIDHFLSKIDLLYVDIPDNEIINYESPVFFCNKDLVRISNLQEEEIYRVSVINCAGQTVFSRKLKGLKQASFHIGQGNGLYLLSINNGTTVKTGKIIINK